jgi:pyruvate kinase
MSPNPDDFAHRLRSLVDPLATLHGSLRKLEREASAALRAVDPAHAASARNLVHYLALRRSDLRALQDRLASVGLSSLGRAESCVGATLDNALALIARATDTAVPPRDPDALTLDEGRKLLERNTCALLGRARPSRRVRIMVTLPTEAADQPALVRELLRRGMDVARVNCAHDGPEVWSRMIAHVRRAASELSTPCRVLMDLPGPKLRTGALAPGPEVVKIKPTRDLLGRMIVPGQAWLCSGDEPAPAGAVRLPVDGAWLSRLREGDRIELTDARQAKRSLLVTRAGAGGVLAGSSHTLYVASAMPLRAPGGESQVGCLPAREQTLLLRPGDHLLVTRDGMPGEPGPPPHIPCTLPQVFHDVHRGDRIWFDDGAIGGRIVAAGPERLDVEITDAPAKGAKLRADKGINLPDTTLQLPALSHKDEEVLAFVAAHADLVGYSFVRRPSDVVALHERLVALGRRDLGVLLKIETGDAFERLPELLLAAMQRPNVGVMIARGDLAVECGWERLAELQEEILWICEAAHLPVIWATQVLETLAKEGRPSRAEITDAAMAERAECVMLNKGEHLAGAVQVLDDILRRMEGHQSKKRSMLRPLALAERFATRGD